MPSCVASSFSQGDAFISSKPLRTTTVTSSPPSRRDERQQSIAVLPPPSTTTRRPILSMWPNETLESQSMPIWMCSAASLRPGMSRSRPRGAPQPTKTASQSWLSSVFRLLTCSPKRVSTPISRIRSTFFVGDRLRQAEARDLRAHHAAALDVAVEHHAVIAERHQVAGDGQRGRAGADEGDALAVLLARDLRADTGGCRPCCRRRRASAGRSPPAPSRPGRAGRRARRDGRRCARGCRERCSSTS